MPSQEITELNAALDDMNLATSAQDAATTVLETESAALAERVKNDDQVPQDIKDAAARVASLSAAISANSTKVSNNAALLAGIEPVEVEVPPIEPVPPIEEVPPV